VANSVPGFLGPYRLLNVVHTGHASQLWQAYDDDAQRLVGIKTLLEGSRKNREEVGYLRREYAVGKRTKHRCIIQMYAFDSDRGQPYLAMEWFSAPNMKQRIHQGLDKIAGLIPRIIDQAAEGLGYLNRLGWVHRDVKPDNFLVGDNGDVKLIDFSLAKRRPGWLSRWFSGRSKIQGTKSYISPEQIRGQPVDQRADLYSFACSVFELISGRPPFTGESVNDLLNKHLKAAPPSLEAVSSCVTPDFADLIRRCLAKDPNARPESVDEFLVEYRMMRPLRASLGGLA
jgi:eukaryotic-like serine/threonine-protein kinase